MRQAKFLTPLRHEKIGASRWILIDHLIFYSVIYNGIFIAPRGFQTDLASIPQPFQFLISKVGKHDRPATIHDAGYGNALMTEHGERIFCVKKVSDLLFNEGMIAEDVNVIQRKIMYRAVRMFGNPIGHPLAQNGRESAIIQ